MLAVNNGDRIECGKCGSCLAMRVGNYVAVKVGNEVSDATLEIKCKARKNGKSCGEADFSFCLHRGWQPGNRRGNMSTDVKREVNHGNS